VCDALCDALCGEAALKGNVALCGEWEEDGVVVEDEDGNALLTSAFGPFGASRGKLRDISAGRGIS